MNLDGVQILQTLNSLKPLSIPRTLAMENHSHSSLPNSRHNSSPSSNEVDNENPSFDESLSTINNHKVKLMCSYGGNVQFRAHDNQLAYVGGDTKIITIDRNIKFSPIMAKLSSLCNADVFFKYQLPGEDLDVLISVTNDEDLEHMMVEYDQMTHRASAKRSRLRLFLFTPKSSTAPMSFGPNNLNPEQQWFVDALNSVHIPRVERSSPSAPVSAPANPDFLFGLDNRYSVVPAPNLPHDSSVPDPPASSTVAKDSSAVMENGGSEERQVVGEPAASTTPGEVQIQIQELQKSHIGNNNEQILQHENDEGNGKVNNNTSTTMDVAYSSQKNPDKAPLQPPVPSPAPSLPAHSVPAPAPSVPLPMAVYLPERQMASAGYSLAANSSTTVADHQQPLYLIATPTVMYHATTLRTVTGQPCYGVPIYNGAPVQTSLSHSQARISNGANHNFETSTGMVLQSKLGVSEAGYAQVAYDNTGRQVYIAAPAWSGVVPPYQDVAAGSDAKQDGNVSNKAASAV